jgi:hypothetical protein
MDSKLIVGAILVLLIGLVIAFFLKFIKSTADKNEVSNANNQDLQNLKLLVKQLGDEKLSIQQKLSETENLLNNFQNSKDRHLPSDSHQLENELRKLKDEIEELEDDLKDNKKSNEKILKEKNELEGKCVKGDMEIKSLLEVIENLKKDLNTSEEDSKSLEFINDILNAKNSSDKDFEEAHLKVQAISTCISDEVQTCFKNYGIKSDIPLNKEAESWRNAELKTWIKGKKIVAIVGEFSSGKTSIVNRILSQDNPDAVLLPTSSKETTAIPTYISNSTREVNFQFYSPENELRTIKEKTFKLVIKSVLDKVNASHLIKYFVLSYQNPFLDDLSILDTPGFGSNSKDIIKRTTEVVNEADVLFWVIDANTGDINQTSIDVMKKHLNKIPLYFIINKSDTKSPDDLDQLQRKIEDTAKTNHIEYKEIIRFHQSEKIELLMRAIKGIKIREHPRLVSYVNKNIEILIKKELEQKNDLHEERKGISKDIYESQDRIRYIEDEIKHLAEKASRLVHKKDTFWSGTYYKINENEYDDFSECVKKIVEYSDQIDVQTELYKDNIEKSIGAASKITKNKYDLEKLEKVQGKLKHLIKEYNPNILNLIENDHK